MLDWIDIKNFAIAKHVELEFGSGLSVITGETGAGKSLVINALNAVLGNRIDTSLVRHGQSSAEIQASFTLDSEHIGLVWLRDNDLEDENQCILRRVISVEKTNRAYINGRAVSATQLRELGVMLIDIHGQHEHQSLMKPQAQLALIDQFGKTDKLAAQLALQYKDLKLEQDELEQLLTQENDTKDRLDLINFQLTELTAFAPALDEWPHLEQEHKRLHHQADVANVKAAVNTSLIDTHEGTAAIEQIATSRSQLESLTSILPEASQHINGLLEIETLLTELAREIDSTLSQSELDHERLSQIEVRYSEYHTLARKYQTTPEQLFNKFEQMQETQAALQNPELEKEALKASIKEKLAHFKTLAARLSSKRESAAANLAESVSESMQQLGMKGGSLQAKLKPTGEDKISSNGNETIELEVITNPGFPAQALTRIASGGELSRISLAIQVLLAKDKNEQSMVFDEVDVGIGGQTAAIVGKLLNQLAVHSQILCITHLAQVAAQGNSHYKVVKSSTDETETSIVQLNAAERINEIARMVGGEQLTKASLAHAESLLASS